MLQRYKFFSKYYSDIPKIHHDLLAIYDINTLLEREQARDSVSVPSVTFPTLHHSSPIDGQSPIVQ